MRRKILGVVALAMGAVVAALATFGIVTRRRGGADDVLEIEPAPIPPDEAAAAAEAEAAELAAAELAGSAPAATAPRAPAKRRRAPRKKAATAAAGDQAGDAPAS